MDWETPVGQLTFIPYISETYIYSLRGENLTDRGLGNGARGEVITQTPQHRVSYQDHCTTVLDLHGLTYLSSKFFQYCLRMKIEMRCFEAFAVRQAKPGAGA